MEANIVHTSAVQVAPPEVAVVDIDPCQPTSLCRAPSASVLEQRANAAVADPAKKLTMSEYKKIMRQYFTVTHPNVAACGHKLDCSRQPNNNCEACWFAFFNVHGELIETTDDCIKKMGLPGLTALKGEKYVKNFLKFMSTLAKWQAATQAAK